MDDRSTAIRQLLAAHRRGDGEALGRVVPLLYQDLRRLARRQLRRGRGGGTLNTTALVHEAYLKVAGKDDWESRSHFLAVASMAMRQVMVNLARDRSAQKRGGGERPETLDEAEVMAREQAAEVLAVDAALGRLKEIDERLCRLVECRFFAGLTEEETAAALEVSPRTVQRDWVRARGWLRRELGR
jgi:RNA polymerase sigma factor (TIGR02999 family)